MKTPYYIGRLRSELVTRITRNPQYSLRAFARSLEMEASALSQILAGKRFPSEKLAQKLFSKLTLTPAERTEFLRSLGKTKVSKGLKRISPALREKSRASNASADETAMISAGDFQVIAEWYFIAILELTFVEGFKATPSWVAARLGLSEIQAKLAMETLIERGFLKKKGARLIKTTQVLATADPLTTTSAHRFRQLQILKLASHSIENDPIERRNHTGVTLATHPARIAEAKKRIDKFMDEIMEFLETGPKTHVYELAIQLFPLSKESK